MTAAVASKKTIKITIQTHQLYFKEPLDTVDFLDWNVFTADLSEAYKAPTPGDDDDTDPDAPLTMSDFTTALNTLAAAIGGTGGAGAAVGGGAGAAVGGGAPAGAPYPCSRFQRHCSSS